MKLSEIKQKAEKGFRKLTNFRIYSGVIATLIFSISVYYDITNIKMGEPVTLLFPLSIFGICISLLFMFVSGYTLIKAYKNQEKTSLAYPIGAFFNKKGKVLNNFDEIETLYKMSLVLAQKDEKFKDYTVAFEYLDFNKKALQSGLDIPYEVMKDIRHNQDLLSTKMDKMLEQFLRQYASFTQDELLEIEALVNQPLEEVMKLCPPPKMEKNEEQLFLEKINPNQKDAKMSKNLNTQSLSL